MWGFARRSPRSLEVTPKHEELFRDADNMADSVTRETSQNSADARSGPGGVTIRIARRTVRADTFLARWYDGLAPHMEGWKPLSGEVLSTPEIECLVIEDFGTSGLTGPTEGPGGGFHAFWRQYGRSSKQGDTGGRHGEGKSTLAGSSHVRMFFGLTIRSDGRRLLMGQAILGPHEVVGEKFEAYGEFSPTKGDELPQPFEDEETLGSFVDDFGISRADEPGLSLVIPFVRSEIVADDMSPIKRAVVANCFPQIASGLLAFDLEGEVLDAVTLGDWGRRYGGGDLQGAIALAQEAASPSRIWEAVEGAEITDLSFEADSLEEMRRAFQDGELLSVRVPVTVKRRMGVDETGAMWLHVRRIRPGERAAEHYSRSRLTVPKQRKVLAGGDLVGMLMAEDGPLSDFLGDAEPPSHARWTHQNLRDTARYRDTQSTLTKVANALRQLERVLRAEGEESVNQHAFKSLLSRPKPRPERDTETTSRPRLEIPPARPFWSVERKPGGFCVTRPDGVLVQDVDIELAYAQRKGPPNWRESDFLLGHDVAISFIGEGSVRHRANVIEVRNADVGLRVEATGFDINRDLVVTVLAVEGGENA